MRSATITLQRVHRDERLCFQPVTPERLADLDRFSRAHGKFRYCSCMRWRLPNSRFHALGTEGRAAALDARVRAGGPVGVLAYTESGEPIGWCSIAPREEYGAVLRARSIPTVEGERVWSVVCFYLDSSVRHTGLRAQLLEAAVEYARTEGAQVVEAYPSPGDDLFEYMGARELYLRAGFHDVEVPEDHRPVMRRELDQEPEA